MYITIQRQPLGEGTVHLKRKKKKPAKSEILKKRLKKPVTAC